MLLVLRKEGKARWSGSGSVTDLVQRQQQQQHGP